MKRIVSLFVVSTLLAGCAGMETRSKNDMVEALASNRNEAGGPIRIWIYIGSENGFHYIWESRLRVPSLLDFIGPPRVRTFRIPEEELAIKRRIGYSRQRDYGESIFIRCKRGEGLDPDEWSFSVEYTPTIEVSIEGEQKTVRELYASGNIKTEKGFIRQGADAWVLHGVWRVFRETLFFGQTGEESFLLEEANYVKGDLDGARVLYTYDDFMHLEKTETQTWVNGRQL